MNTRNEDLIAAHITYLGAGAYSTRTIDEAARVLRILDRQLPHGLDNACTEELEVWLNRPTWSRRTKSTYRETICRFYRWSVRPQDQWLATDPASGLHRPKLHPGVPTPASDADVAATLTLPWPWSLHCLLAAYAGLRPCEIAVLDRLDVTPENITIGHGKGDKAATVPTHPDIWNTIADLPPGPVTRRRDGSPADAHWVTSSTAERLHRRGIRATLRNLRHWYGTTLLASCHDLRVVQECMRHSSVATTQGYTAVVDGQRRAAVAALPTLTAPAGSDPVATVDLVAVA